MIEYYSDFFVPLMRILDALPDRSGKSGDVLRIFEKTYRDQIVPFQYTQNQSGRFRWEHNVRWSREKLKTIGFLDAPAVGIWRLNEAGHQWLVEHPEATHLTIKQPRSKVKTKKTQQAHSKNLKANQAVSLPDLFDVLQENIANSLQSIVGPVSVNFAQRSNYLQIHLAGYSGCHYEIILGRARKAVALHFESSAERSQARLRGFEPHIDLLTQTFNMPVHAGDFGTRGWTQVLIETQVQPLSFTLAKEHADLSLRFIAVTFPILKNIYASDIPHRQPTNRLAVKTDRSLHEILDQEVGTLRSFLQGSSSIQVSDEKLCDWINFCYTFGLYAEGRDLFSLISSTEVNPWYFERTKRIAKVCEQKVKMGLMKEI